MHEAGYKSIYGDTSASRVIIDEIKSIQTDRRKPLPDYMAKDRKKKPDDYYKELQDYLSTRKPDSSLRSVSGLSGGSAAFFRSRQATLDDIVAKFTNDTDLTTLQFYTSNRDYHKDRFDKLKIFQFYEDNVHKLRRNIERQMVDDLNEIRKYLEEVMRDITTLTSTIFGEYFNIYQRGLNSELLKVLNDEKHNVYDPETKILIEKVVRRESNDYLKYKTFFPDFIKLVEFSNTNKQLKNKFIQQNFKFNTFDHVPVSSYLEMLNKNIDSLADFSGEGLKDYQLGQVKKAQQSQYLNSYRDKAPQTLSMLATSVVSEHRDDRYLTDRTQKTFNGSLIELPPDEEPMFEMGEATKMAEPYWMINQIIETKTVSTSHSDSDTINDFILIDKDRYAITCSNDRSIRITNMISGDNRLAIPFAHQDGSRCLLFHTKGVIVSGGKDGEIKLFDPTIGQSKGILVGHRETVWKMIEMPGEALVSCSEDHSLKFWNIDLLNCYKTIVSPQNKPIRSLIRYTESKLFFAGTRVWLYNVNRDDIEKTFSGHSGQIRSMAVDIKNNRLITGSDDDTLRFWSIESCQMLKVISCTEPRSMVVYQNQYLITGNADFTVKFWDLGLSRLICVKKTKIHVDTVQVTNDNKILYAEYNDLVMLKNPGV